MLYLQGCKDWSAAITKALPQRKVQKAKQESHTSLDGDPSSAEEDLPTAKKQKVLDELEPEINEPNLDLKDAEDACA